MTVNLLQKPGSARHAKAVSLSNEKKTANNPAKPMPLYEYICRKGRKEFGEVLSIKEHDTKKLGCRKCRSTDLETVIEPFFAKTASKTHGSQSPHPENASNMKTRRTPSTAPHAGGSPKKARTKQRGTDEFAPEIPVRWRWHYETLARLRDRLIEERGAHPREGAEPIERHSMHQADSATDEFDHGLALGQISEEQDALYKVEAAMKRIIGLNEEAFAEMRCRKELKIVPGATHLFEEPGALEEVARLAAAWFRDHLHTHPEAAD